MASNPNLKKCDPRFMLKLSVHSKSVSKFKSLLAQLSPVPVMPVMLNWGASLNAADVPPAVIPSRPTCCRMEAPFNVGVTRSYMRVIPVRNSLISVGLKMWVHETTALCVVRCSLANPAGGILPVCHCSGRMRRLKRA